IRDYHVTGVQTCALPIFAMEVILTGDMFGAERAYGYGLVNRLTEPGKALEGALELARVIVENGPLAVQTAKGIVVQGTDWEQEEIGRASCRQRGWGRGRG